MKNRTAKEIIADTPVMCYAVLGTTKELIRIYAGESGYYKCSQLLPEREVRDGRYENMDALANAWNAENEISRGQRAAMEAGSMYGWAAPAADPKNYTEDGKYIIKAETV